MTSSPAPEFELPHVDGEVALRDIAAFEHRLGEIEELLDEAGARRQGDADVRDDDEPPGETGEGREPEPERN